MKAKSFLLPALFGGLLLVIYNFFIAKSTFTVINMLISFFEGALFVMLPYLAIVAASRLKSLSYLENTVTCIFAASILAGIFRILLIPNIMLPLYTFVMVLTAFIMQATIVAISLLLTNLFDN